MFSISSQDPCDHWAKIIVSTTFGDHDLEDDGSPEFWREAAKLMGAA